MLTSVVGAVAIGFVEKIVVQEGYGWFRRRFFPKKRYQDELCKLIEETCSDFEKKYPIEVGGRIPFYHSQPLFDALNEYLLFTKPPSKEKLLVSFRKYPEVIPPTQEQLNYFYVIFLKKINNSKKIKKVYFSENYKEKIFEVWDEIVQAKLLLQSIDQKLTFNLNEDWLNQRNRQAIADLGGRYTPELNAKLEISSIFEGLGRTDSFYDLLYKHIDSFIIKGKKIKECREISGELSVISGALNDIRELFLNINLSSSISLPIDELYDCLQNCHSAIQDAEKILWELKEQAHTVADFNNKYSNILWKLKEFDSECSILEEFLSSIVTRLSNNPFLLLDGEAGIGKSHLLADAVESRMVAGRATLFLLGQQFTTDEAPWIQIFKRLQINIASKEFLEKLNLYAENSGNRFLIFIDAINEGSGNRFWKKYINSFIDEIKSYQWLGLVMSVRTAYKGAVILDEQVIRNKIETHKHLGFSDTESEAINLFYDYYEIEKPSSPNLNPEFKNPLFLKILCEGIKRNGLNSLPVGVNGIYQIFDFYLKGINKSLALPEKINFDPSLQLVRKAIDGLIQTKLDSGDRFILYEQAHIAVQLAVQDYTSEKNFLRSLIDEGILIKHIIRDENGSQDEAVFISFERLEDHLTVDYLLDRIKNIEIEFEVDGRFKCYFENEYDLYLNQGIVEALSIQLPEKFDKELYELLPAFVENDSLIKAFLGSLIWRDPAAIKVEKIKPFINKHIVRYKGSLNGFLETLVAVTGVSLHPLNANFLHSWLLQYALSERDAFWTVELKYKHDKGSSFRSLIDWAWGSADKSYVSEESIELVATTLCWFLTSSNRKLRDYSTKALVNLLENRILTLVKIIKKFKEIDDPYVWERVLAVTLGCALRTKEYKNLSQLAETIYLEVFNDECVYPHILLRDYARETIEYISFLGQLPENLNISKTKPPYKSTWPENISTRDELELLYDKDEYWEIWSSVICGGDFSRYIIGTNHQNTEWSSHKVGSVPINRKKILKDFKSRLSDEQVDLFTSMDPKVYSTEDSQILTGTTPIKLKFPIGRKNDEEILESKTIFKNSLQNNLLVIFESDIEPYLDQNNELSEKDEYFDLRVAERFILKRVMELGWRPNLHGEYDRSIGAARARSDSYQERIGKKYQWIAFYEYMALLSDNFIRYQGFGVERKVGSYHGPWEPYVRDIDPTILLKNTTLKEQDSQSVWWNSKEVFNWDCTLEEWASSSAILSNPYSLIEVSDPDNTKWLVLESNPSWIEPKHIGYESWETPRKEIWCQLKSYLVEKKDFKVFKNWTKNQHYMGRWMPECSERYELYNREYYWSEAFQFFQTDYYSGADWTSIVDQDSKDKIADVSVTSIYYSWQEEFDFSKDGSLNFLKPSYLVFNKMGLSCGEVDGEYKDEKGDVVCFSAKSLANSKNYLLVKKEPFLKMLNDNNLEIVWTLLGEKRVIEGFQSSNQNYNHVEFSGSFYFENGQLEGAYKLY